VEDLFRGAKSLQLSGAHKHSLHAGRSRWPSQAREKRRLRSQPLVFEDFPGQSDRPHHARVRCYRNLRCNAGICTHAVPFCNWKIFAPWLFTLPQPVIQTSAYGAASGSEYDPAATLLAQPGGVSSNMPPAKSYHTIPDVVMTTASPCGDTAIRFAAAPSCNWYHPVYSRLDPRFEKSQRVNRETLTLARRVTRRTTVAAFHARAYNLIRAGHGRRTTGGGRGTSAALTMDHGRRRLGRWRIVEGARGRRANRAWPAARTPPAPVARAW